MGLLFRLFLTLLLGRWRTPVPPLGPCVTPFRVLPNDLDVLGHMTNGRYFSILDLARVDLMLRSGLLPKLRKNGWYPVVSLETLRFHRSLELWQRYEVVTRVICWDDKHVFIEQSFVRDGVQVAFGMVRARMLKRGGTVAVPDLLALAGVELASPPAPQWVAQWSAAEGGMVLPGAAGKDNAA